MSGRYAEEDIDSSVINRDDVFYTNIPGRLDRLPWSRWHWFVATALGIAWILDGIEVSTVSLSLRQLHDLWGISATKSSLIGTVYVCGTLVGSILFGSLADKYGRKRLFVLTPATYLLATIGAATSQTYAQFIAANFFIGLGIGGEYSAMNSAINELIPSAVRGWVDLAINGSYWLGVAISASMSIYFLNTNNFETNVGFRIPFGIGAVLAFFVVLSRFLLDESPRWLLTHNQPEEAERIVRKIEEKVESRFHSGEMLSDVPATLAVRLNEKHMGLIDVAVKTFSLYPKRAALGAILMISQAFFYNAIFFSFSMILTTFYTVPPDDVGIYLIPFAIGNFLGAVTIGRFFDTIGRKKMICFTYTMSGLLLLVTGVLFEQGVLNKYTQTLCWSIVFFFSSAGASSAYLTISEIFPLEVRALAIALFYSIGAIGGMIGPVLLGYLISSNSPVQVLGGYAIAAVLMFLASFIELIWGIDAEGKSLEEIAAPLSATNEADEESTRKHLHTTIQDMSYRTLDD
eukprot:TRINITY_DN13048_c0_g1_i1.p1 TRINITY_DN13048_c0_g1~~TRINITY_DN13048_c0_g1_i1.p1  ORF type:complete len:517 (+),score=97.00 TRINITY_DN13048_c0_g1_i1:97-1647(+)